jgi:hypothetical protein
MNISEHDSDIFWDVLRKKPAPSDANQKIVAMAKAFRNAKFPSHWNWQEMSCVRQQPSPFSLEFITISLENILLGNGVLAHAKGKLQSAARNKNSQQLYEENDERAELKCEERDNEWVLSFKIIKGEPVTDENDGTKKVDLIITNESTGEFLVDEERELKQIGKMWAFGCYLPEECTKNKISIYVDYELLAN